MPTYRNVERELAAAADPERAASLASFFKTGPGQYGEGDRFLGVTVPVQRRIALRYLSLPLKDLTSLLRSPYHEHRFTALEILVARYERAATNRESVAVVRFYLQNTAYINNWDLVDTSAPYILGEHLKTRSRRPLDRLAASAHLWERRIAIVSTLALIKNGEVNDTFRLAQKLFSDKHDLIHKAVGWALRETGKVSRPALLAFLRQHQSSIPRTALRYAIERFSPDIRRQILTESKAPVRGVS
jgi:3-methyladenine DNA glycosylase AlkD